MGAIRRWVGRLALKAVQFDDLWKATMALQKSRSGPTVTELNALQVTTVLRCIRVLGNGVAQVPLKLYRPEGKGSQEANDYPLYRVFARRPNPWQTSFQFRRTLVLHRALAGKFVAYKNRAAGVIRELIPIPPERVDIIFNRDMSRTFRVTWEDGRRQDLQERDVWYLPDLSWDNRKALAGVQLAREAIGLAMAAEQTHADFHANGGRTTGVLSVKGRLSADRYDRLEKWIDERLTGANRFKPLIADNGADYKSMTQTGVEAQHIELRKHQIEEVCRAFDVFPQMVGHAGDQTPTFASAEQFFIAHVVHTLMPWYTDIEQSVDALIEDEGEGEIYAKFNQRALLRGAMKDEADALAKALGSGGAPPWLTQDEVRALQERNPMGGDAAVLAKPGNATAKPPQKPEDDPENA